MKKLFNIEELEADVFGSDESLDWELNQKYAQEIERESDSEDFPALELEITFEDGRVLECETVGVFLAGENEYIAVHPKNDTDGIVHIMKFTQGEDDEIILLPIEEENEFVEAEKAFHHLIADDDVKGDMWYDGN